MGKSSGKTAFNLAACFVKGTPVFSENGFMNIEDVEVGDRVWAENPETGEKELKAVAQTFTNETNIYGA